MATHPASTGSGTIEARADILVGDAVAAYCAKYSIEPPFATGELHSLALLGAFWRIARHPGCYIFYNKQKELLHVGKASMGNTVSARLRDRFKRMLHSDAYETSKSRKLGDFRNWSHLIVFVQPIEVNYAHEAASLEEFLIEKLQPPYNKNGAGGRVNFVSSKEVELVFPTCPSCGDQPMTSFAQANSTDELDASKWVGAFRCSNCGDERAQAELLHIRKFQTR